VIISRTEFLKRITLTAGAASLGKSFANSLHAPLGIQLYTVRNDLTADSQGTLLKLRTMGYREVEASIGSDGQVDFNGGTPREFKRRLNEAGLLAPSCHFHPPDANSEWQRNIEAAQELNCEYMLCATPPHKTNSLEAWKHASDFFNGLGKQCHEAGIQFAYHNHNAEFRVYDGVVAYDELLRLTDKNLVKMEMDCFWTTFAGKDPLDYLQRHPDRFPLLHIKDLKSGYKPTTGEFEGNPFCEVGSGVIDWKRIFRAATGLKHYYVEQDMWDRPSLESAAKSAEYLNKI
jgi:sugar phosphate isomerase/epimerase